MIFKNFGRTHVNLVLITVVTVVAATLAGIFYTLQESYAVHMRIKQEYVPALHDLDSFESNLLRSKDLIKEWAFVQRVDEDKNKAEMRELSESKLNMSFQAFRESSMKIHDISKLALDTLEHQLQSYLKMCNQVQALLPSFESYSDPIAQMEAESFFLENSGIPLMEQKCMNTLEALRSSMTSKMNTELEALNRQFDRLMLIIGVVALFVVLAGLIIGFFAKQLRIQREETQAQKEILDQLYQDLTDSIQYAQRLQSTILPTLGNVRQLFPKSFIFYQPKSVVSGDFYWFKNVGGKKLFAAADCTGHGVPGALMSMIGNTLLNEIVNQKNITDPGLILKHLNEGVIKALRQSGIDIMEQDDGMDICVCRVDETKNNKLVYASANLSLFVVNKGSVKSLDSDIFSIGGGMAAASKVFVTKTEIVEPGSMVIMSTDGYYDQFGGSRNSKFLISNFEKLLSETENSADASQLLKTRFENWRGDKHQTDDVLVLGFKI